MSKLHVLSGSNFNYQVAVHQNAPAGNNSAGFSWSSVIVKSGRNRTALTVGVDAGQITQVEFDAILAGTVIECVSGVTDDPTMTGPQRNAELDAQATVIAASYLTKLQNDLKFYGVTRN